MDSEGIDNDDSSAMTHGINMILGCKVGYNVLHYMRFFELQYLRMVCKTISKLVTQYMAAHHRWNLSCVELSQSITTVPKERLVNILIDPPDPDITLSACSLFGDEDGEMKFEEQNYYLPPHVVNVQFGKYFNKMIHFTPECTVTSLTFGKHFDCPIDNLPNTITHLTFGLKCWFNQRIDKLPNSITFIRFDLYSCFNQPIDHLPTSLQELVFDGYFNQPIDHLPNSLKSIQIGYCSALKRPLHHLPPSLEIFKSARTFMDYRLNNLPSLKVAYLYWTIEFPPSLLKLSVRTFVPHFEWPPFLTHLIIGGVSCNLSTLPPTLTHLKTSINRFATLSGTCPGLKVFICSTTIASPYNAEKFQLLFHMFPSLETLAIFSPFNKLELKPAPFPPSFRKILVPKGTVIAPSEREKLEEQIELRVLKQRFMEDEMEDLPPSARAFPHDFTDATTGNTKSVL